MSSTGESVKVTLLFKRKVLELNLYTATKMTSKLHPVNICINNFKVGWDEPDAIQHLNILFRRAMSSLKMVATRRNFYMPEKAMKVPQHK